MAKLKQIKFGANSTPIAMTQVAINENSNKVLSVVGTNTGLNDDADPLYTLALAVDGKTITKTGNDGLATALKLTYHAAVTTSGSEKGAYIALEDVDGTSIANSEIPVSNLIGNGVLKSSAYSETTGILTLTFATASGEDTTVDINLGKMLDIDDVAIASGSSNYLSFALADPSSETGQAVIGAKMATVTGTTSTLSADETNGALLDASETITAVKTYVDGQVSAVAVTASGDNYITAEQDNNDVKKINVTADVQNVTSSAGTRGTWSVTDAGDGTAATKTLTGETAPSISGVANSLVDGSDVATKVATYVDAVVAAESDRADAEVLRAIKSLDVDDTAVSGKYVSAVSEADGKISVTRANVGEAVLTGFTADSSASGAIAATDTISAALNKLQNTASGIQYNVSGTTLEFFGMTQHQTV